MTELPAGYHLAARPTNYRGTRMRSRLEATVAAALDAAGVTWAYEPIVLAGTDGQWLPDFGIVGCAGTTVYVEVRPTAELARRGLVRYAAITAECDASALVVAAGFVNGDPLWCFTATGQSFRLPAAALDPGTGRARLGGRDRLATAKVPIDPGTGLAKLGNRVRRDESLQRLTERYRPDEAVQRLLYAFPGSNAEDERTR